MTHDELLTSIKDRFNNHTGKHDAEIANALYRVVELHKPKYYDKYPTLQCPCGVCDREWEIWPCPTIKVIEKELT